MASGQARPNVGGEDAGNQGSNALINFCGASNMNVDLSGLTVQNFSSEPGSSRNTEPRAEQDGVSEQRFINVFNSFTNERTQDKLTSTFSNLSHPERQVNPGFIVTNYYQGDTSPVSREYDPKTSSDSNRHIIGQIIPLENILDGVNYVALVASAGNGKTISAKRFAQMVLRRELPDLDSVELVHYINIAELDSESLHTVYDLLFVQPLGTRLSDTLREFGYSWIRMNGKRILLVLDGLDQVSWRLKEEHTISYNQPANVSVIFYNILNKDLLKDCRIVITSREHSIRHFTAPMRPNRTVALSGLSMIDREYLIKQLGGDHGEQIWKHLLQHSPSLVALCETPGFLVFTAAVLIDNLENLPSTMSGVLVRVLAYFLNSENRLSEEIDDIFDKLKILAFTGTCERRVIYKVSELRQFDLSVEQVSDFVAVAPKKDKTRHFRLMEGKMNLFFCHQLIQESLSALNITQFGAEEFQTFVMGHFDDPHFTVVRKIILGIVLNPQVGIQDLCEIEDHQKKIKILQTWLRDKVEATQNQNQQNGNREDSTLFSLLHECGNGAIEIIKDSIKSVKSFEKLKGESLFIVASVLKNVNVVNEAWFSTMCLSDADVKLVYEGLSKCRNVKISVIRIEFQQDESFSYLGKILKIATTENIIFSNCSISRTKIITLNSAMQNTIQYIESLDFTDTNDIEIGAFEPIGEFIKKINAGDIQMNSCKLSHQKLSQLWNALKNYDRQIKQLGMSGNDEMSAESMKYIGEIVKKGKTEHINISRCKLTANHLSEFEEGLQGYSGQIKRFDLSRNDTMTADAYKPIGNILSAGKVENLNLCHCKLETGELRTLKEHSVGFYGHMKSLDVAWNGRSIDYKILGEIVENWKLEELICHGCFQEQRHVDEFIGSLREMRNKVKITHGSENISSTTTNVDEFRHKILEVTKR